MTYLLLAVAIVAEVAGTSLLKATEGFSRLLPTLGCVAGYLLSIVALSAAVQRGLDVGIGYAVWAGLGTTLIVVIGALYLDEPLTPAKVAGVVLVIAGVVVLNLSGAH